MVRWSGRKERPGRAAKNKGHRGYLGEVAKPDRHLNFFSLYYSQIVDILHFSTATINIEKAVHRQLIEKMVSLYIVVWGPVTK